MKLGMIGLGRMGSNMVRRVLGGGHTCVVFDIHQEAALDLAKAGATGARGATASPPRRSRRARRAPILKHRSRHGYNSESDHAYPPVPAVRPRRRHAHSLHRSRPRTGYVAIALGVRSKVPREAMVGQELELLATRGIGIEMAAYERLLGYAMKGDATLFAREDAVEAEWRIVAPILTSTTSPHEYQPGTWGPAEADRLIDRPGGWAKPFATRTEP